MVYVTTMMLRLGAFFLAHWKYWELSSMLAIPSHPMHTFLSNDSCHLLILTPKFIVIWACTQPSGPYFLGFLFVATSLTKPIEWFGGFIWLLTENHVWKRRLHPYQIILFMWLKRVLSVSHTTQAISPSGFPIE